MESAGIIGGIENPVHNHISNKSQPKSLGGQERLSGTEGILLLKCGPQKAPWIIKKRARMRRWQELKAAVQDCPTREGRLNFEAVLRGILGERGWAQVSVRRRVRKPEINDNKKINMSMCLLKKCCEESNFTILTQGIRRCNPKVADSS